MFDLTKAELFKSLLVFKTKETVIDLHNDYDCENINYEFDKSCLKCLFKGKDEVTLEFSDVIITKLGLLLKRTSDSSILNNFYRGRFEQEGVLREYSNEGKGYYHLEFEKGDSIDLHASNVFLYKSA